MQRVSAPKFDSVAFCSQILTVTVELCSWIEKECLSSLWHPYWTVCLKQFTGGECMCRQWQQQDQLQGNRLYVIREAPGQDAIVKKVPLPYRNLCVSIGLPLTNHMVASVTKIGAPGKFSFWSKMPNQCRTERYPVSLGIFHLLKPKAQLRGIIVEDLTHS